MSSLYYIVWLSLDLIQYLYNEGWIYSPNGIMKAWLTLNSLTAFTRNSDLNKVVLRVIMFAGPVCFLNSNLGQIHSFYSDYLPV